MINTEFTNTRNSLKGRRSQGEEALQSILEHLIITTMLGRAHKSLLLLGITEPWKGSHLPNRWIPLKLISSFSNRALKVLNMSLPPNRTQCVTFQIGALSRQSMSVTQTTQMEFLTLSKNSNWEGVSVTGWCSLRLRTLLITLYTTRRVLTTNSLQVLLTEYPQDLDLISENLFLQSKETNHLMQVHSRILKFVALKPPPM